MESKFLQIINDHPEIIGITKYRSLNGLVCYSENINTLLIHSVCWIYQNYFSINVKLFVPNMTDGDICTLEVLEKYIPNKNEIVIFAWSELIFKDFNKKRLNTLLKSIAKKNKIILFSMCSLKCTQFPFLELFDFYELPKINGISFTNLLNNISLFDLVDPDQENYQNNLESFIEFVSEFKVEQKSVYMSLNLQPNKLIEIETLLKKNGITVSRKDSEQADIIINSCKTRILTQKYHVMILSPPIFEDPLELVCFFKDIFTSESEIFIDSSKIKNITQNLKLICNASFEKKAVIKDSVDFESYTELKKEVELNEAIMATDAYYTFQVLPVDLLKLDLSNLSKKDYDLIRAFVKNKLIIKYNLEIKTCQLSSPCSPKDRSKKLNSLSNKISSYDYRCDCTCEIFKDYTIGVIVWNDFFKNRKKINVLKNNVYVYQTTNGLWKYTTVV